MSVRLPIWAAEAVENFHPDYDNWYQESFLGQLERRRKFQQEGRGRFNFTKTSLINVLGHLKRYLFRMFSTELLTNEFNEWIAACQKSKDLNKYDERLVKMIVITKQPQDIIKLQSEVRSKLKKNPKFGTVVGREFIKLKILKKSIVEVIENSSRSVKRIPIKKENQVISIDEQESGINSQKE